MGFLRERLPPLILEAGLPAEIVNNLIYLHDGTPAHGAHIVRNALNTMFPERWVGRGGPLPWPARSPDLNAGDYYLWGRIKNVVYQGDTSTRELTWLRIQQAFQNLQPAEIRRATENIYERARLCLANNGMHFEHL